MKVAIAGAGFVLLAGCATFPVSQADYTPPKVVEVANEYASPASFDEVWDKLIAHLSASFFVINNIDKASRLVNVSFSTDAAAAYVDCGHTKRSFSFQGSAANYSYEAAETSNYQLVTVGGAYYNLPVVAALHRKVSLEGRINVYVAPAPGAGTKVAVNVKYIVAVNITGTGTLHNAFGGAQQSEAIPPTTLNYTFNTKAGPDVTTNEVRSGDMVCVPNGKLESLLVDFAK